MDLNSHLWEFQRIAEHDTWHCEDVAAKSRMRETRERHGAAFITNQLQGENKGGKRDLYRVLKKHSNQIQPVDLVPTWI